MKRHAPRPNWFEIPELKKTYDELNAEVQRGRVNEADEAFQVFRRAALTSADLLFADARSITEKVDRHVKEVLTGQQTAATRPAPLPELATFSPFTD